MEYIVLSIILIAVIAAVAMPVIKQKRKSKVLHDNHAELSPLVQKQNIVPNDEQMQEFVIKLEALPEERSLDENKLVEIKGSKILAHVNNLVPELAKVRNAAHNAAQAAQKNGEILYKIDIPMSELVKSKDGNYSINKYLGSDELVDLNDILKYPKSNESNGFIYDENTNKLINGNNNVYRLFH